MRALKFKPELFFYTLVSLLFLHAFVVQTGTKTAARWTSVSEIVNATDDNFDLAYALLHISNTSSTDLLGQFVDTQRYLNRIDSLTQVLQKRLHGVKTPVQIITVINNFLFSELGFTTDASDTTGRNPRNLFINDVLDRRKGYCLSLALPYLIFAERLNLPIYGVPAPGHFFVRYDDGVYESVNIETTAQGQPLGDDYYNSKYKLDGAHEFYLRNLTKRQIIGVFLNNLGNCYRRANNLREALNLLQAAIKLNPNYPEAHTNLGNVYLLKKNADAAIHEHKKALQLYPLAKAYTNLGSAYTAKGMYNEARKAHLQALEISPELTGAYINLGNIFLKNNEYKAALNRYRTALSFDSTLAIAHANMGSAYQKMGILSKSLLAYKKAIDLDPIFSEAYLNLGNLYTPLGALRDAVKTYKKGIAISPAMFELRLNLANAYRDLHDDKEAISAYLETINVNPNYALAYYNLGLLYSKRKITLPQAVKAYEAAIKYDEKYAEAYLNLGSLFQDDLQDLKKAEKNFKIALKYRPGFTEAHFNMGVVYLKTGRAKKAITAFKTVVAKQKSSVDAFYNLAMAYHETGAAAEEIEALENTIRLDSKRADAHHYLAIAFYKKKKFERAIFHFDQSRRLGYTVDRKFARILSQYRD